MTRIRKRFCALTVGLLVVCCTIGCHISTIAHCAGIITTAEQMSVYSMLRQTVGDDVNFDMTFSCRRLFGDDSAAHQFCMSAVFRTHDRSFLAAVNVSSLPSGLSEGHTYQLRRQYRLLHYLTTTIKSVRNVCETGFNAGHSSFDFLTARNDVTVHSFDIGQHPYVTRMAWFLVARFPNRLRLTLGDSRLTIPQYFSNTSTTCDIIFVDGGHSFDVAVLDILNMARVASAVNIIIVDDTHYETVSRAWWTSLRAGWVKQLMSCAGVQRRSFVVGTVTPSTTWRISTPPSSDITR